jgi:hypothetical protein
VLANKRADLTDMKRKEETLTILRDRLPGQKPPPQLSDGYDIYILGTLCGGTCGGMLIDMAYQIQRIFNIENVLKAPGQSPNIHAIVTVLDGDIAQLQDRSRQAANCWASLQELDYYMDDRSVYDYTLPKSQPFGSTRMPPVTFVQLVSRTNFFGEIFPGKLEGFRGADINLMVALKIFNNIFTSPGWTRP